MDSHHVTLSSSGRVINRERICAGVQCACVRICLCIETRVSVDCVYQRYQCDDEAARSREWWKGKQWKHELLDSRAFLTTRAAAAIATNRQSRDGRGIG
jgi:hypothetical protein